MERKANATGRRCVDWLTKNITYGLFLSDRSVLGDVETEMTVVTGIMMQNLPRESAWHLRGFRRLGVAKEDVEAVWKCVGYLLSFLFSPLEMFARFLCEWC